MPSEHEIFSVNTLVEQIKNLNELSFPDIWLEGEVSTTATPASGHIYFSLKDSQAVVRCVLFKNKRYQAATLPEQGKQLLVRGRVSVYAARCELQLIASYIEDAGDGAIRRAFEQLKARLQLEGLFDQAHKRLLPKHPDSIAIISSESGAALHDILQTIQKRYSPSKVYLIAINVQGAGSAEAAIEALQIAQEQKVDSIILARGGGSKEDLHSFNDEALARAIYACKIPVVTGIGHETDFTIADFVADLRAPTPTGAALACLPDRVDLLQQVKAKTRALNQAAGRQLDTWQLKLGFLQRRLVSPSMHLGNQTKALQSLMAQAHRQAQASITVKAQQLALLSSRLVRQNPAQQIALQQSRLNARYKQIKLLGGNSIQRQQHQLSELQNKLELLNPYATLNRGYSITYDAAGKVISSAKHVSSGEQITTQLADGKLGSIVNN